MQRALTIGAVLLALTGGSLTAGERTEGLFREAMREIEAGEHRRATVFLVAARKLDPADPDIHGWLGVCLLRTGDVRMAVPELEAARAGGAKVPDLDLELARAYYALDRFDEAIEALDRDLASSPGRPEALEIQGLCRFGKGEYVESIRWFRRALESKGPHEAMVREHLARALEAVGMEDSDAAFPDPSRLDPESLQAALVPRPPGREGPRWTDPASDRGKPWAIRLTLAGGFNDNVLLLGEDHVLAPEIAREESGVLMESLLASYVLRLADTTTLVASDAFSGTQYVDLHDFDTLVHNPQLSLNHAFSSEWRSQVGAGWSDVRVDEDRFQSQWDFSAKAEWRPECAPWSSTTVAFTHSRFDYFDPTTSPFDRDGFSNTIRLTERVRVPDTDLAMTVGYEHAWLATEGTQSDREVDRVSARLAHPIPALPGVYAAVDSSYGWFRYHSTDLRALGSQDRRDEVLSIGGSISWEIGSGCTVFTSFEHTRSLSNNDLFEYDRNQALGGIQIQF